MPHLTCCPAPSSGPFHIFCEVDLLAHVSQEETYTEEHEGKESPRDGDPLARHGCQEMEIGEEKPGKQFQYKIIAERSENIYRSILNDKDVPMRLSSEARVTFNCR